MLPSTYGPQLPSWIWAGLKLVCKQLNLAEVLQLGSQNLVIKSKMISGLLAGKLNSGGLRNDVKMILRGPCCEEIQASWKSHVKCSAQPLQLWVQPIASTNYQTHLHSSSPLCSGQLSLCTFPAEASDKGQTQIVLAVVSIHYRHTESMSLFFKSLLWGDFIT